MTDQHDSTQRALAKLTERLAELQAEVRGLGSYLGEGEMLGVFAEVNRGLDAIDKGIDKALEAKSMPKVRAYARDARKGV